MSGEGSLTVGESESGKPGDPSAAVVAGSRTMRTLQRLRLIDLDSLSLIFAIVFGLVFALGQVLRRVELPFDFEFYWRATDFSNLYAPTWLDPGYAYVYPPPLAQLFAPFHVLSFDTALVAWITFCFACLWVCVREWTIPVLLVGLLATLFPPGHVLGAGLTAVLLGNVQIPMTAAIVASRRWPALWVVPLLTKVTTGVGVIWYVARREWRSLAIVIVATTVVATASLILSPQAWIEYIQWTIANYGQPSNPPIVGPPLPIRLVVAIVVVWWGARTNRQWVLPIAAGIAIPAIYGWTTVASVSLGAIGLRRAEQRDRSARRVALADRDPMPA